MGFFTRRLVPSALFSCLVLAAALVPSVATAQSAPAPPPPGGSTPVGDGADGSKVDPKAPPKGEVGGFTFHDGPATPRAAGPRVFHRAGGPQAMFPGFEQLTDGGSRLFVQLSQNVPVEERRASGSVTYVLKGAHLRVHNDANALVTVHFNTPVYRARLTPSGNDLLFVLELRSAATPTFKVQDNTDKTSTLMIDFAKGDFVAADNGDPAQPSIAVDGKLPPGTTAAPTTRPVTTPKPNAVRRGGGGRRSAPVTGGPTP